MKFEKVAESGNGGDGLGKIERLLGFYWECAEGILGATIGNDAIHRGWWELERQRGTREL